MAEFMEEDETLYRPIKKKPKRMPSAFLAFNKQRPSTTSGEEDTTDDPDNQRTVVNPLIELNLLN
eukprot:CAMPEP_0170509778 /NCGR_PEP_ID=MMETSP0208-20121228/65403_1 /TAXON_ID=197538 /ORGANISM="Strombidium inclinatum, Strain S3" /LENGTH=64 /DNA_ID=CAMNT_0010793171 /DNA_START=14 /DNA_END=208 /DNA_ORIENTATION=+